MGGDRRSGGRCGDSALPQDGVVGVVDALRRRKDDSMETVRVTFEPGGQTVEVPVGSTLLEAATTAGIFVTSICGGDGICGKCRLIVEAGEVDAEPTTLLTRDEIQRGYILACGTRIVEGLTVSVPKEDPPSVDSSATSR